MSLGFKIALGLIGAVVVTAIIVLPITYEKDGKGYVRVKTQTELYAIVCASQAYFAEYGSWPTSLTNMMSGGNARNLIFIEPDSLGNFDGWRRPLLYRPHDAKLGYGSVLSLGRDGKPGGTRDDADIEVRF